MDEQREVQGTANPCSNGGMTLGCLVVGLGIGAALSMILAPKSGAETRQWIANKVLNGIDTANEKVRRTRLRVKGVVDQGQQTISEVVVAARESVGTPKARQTNS